MGVRSTYTNEKIKQLINSNYSSHYSVKTSDQIIHPEDLGNNKMIIEKMSAITMRFLLHTSIAWGPIGSGASACLLYSGTSYCIYYFLVVDGVYLFLDRLDEPLYNQAINSIFRLTNDFIDKLYTQAYTVRSGTIMWGG